MQSQQQPSTPRSRFRGFRFPPGALRANTLYLFVIALVAVGSVLRLTGGIFVPFVIALLLSFVFAPVVSWLTAHRVPRFIAILLVMAVFIAFGFLLVLIVYTSFQSLAREFPRYQARFFTFLEQIAQRFDLPADFLDQFQIPRTVGNAILSVSENFLNFGSSLMVVLIFLLFLLIEKPYVRGKLVAALNRTTHRRLSRVLKDINRQIGRYVAVKLFVSSLTAIVVYVSFTIIGVDFPFIWGVLTFLFNFVPSIGSIAISFISLAFLIAQYVPNWPPIIAGFAAMAGAQLVIGNIIDPKMLGDRLNLSPVVILFSLLIWGWLWGVAGLFLAVPLTVAIKIVLEHIPGLEPVGILMGTGNFALQDRSAASGQMPDDETEEVQRERS